MKAFTIASGLAALASVSANPTQTLKEPPTKRGSLPAVSVSGNAFWAGGERFYVRGIDYQPGGSSANIDPLADPDICKRDIKKFKALGVNTIRVYAVDNSKKHDECMKALDDAGIYLVADVQNNEYSINRADPKTSYNTDFLESVFATVEELAQYDNTLAFFSGNEVINDEKDSDKSAPYVKAVQRDVKAYMKSRKLRAVPIGYSAADVDSNRMQTAFYMNCGSDSSRGDFFAFNDYSWCNSDFETSGWDQKVKNFTDYGIPIFLSEWGCIKNRPRNFDEMGALMSDKMTGVYSGGLLYEYSNEDNNYGIVNITDSKVEETDEFDMYAKALSDYPAPTGDGGASKTSAAASCPPSAANWQVDPSLLPEMPSAAKKFMNKGSVSGPGLDGDGSQQAGDSGMATTMVADDGPSSTGGSDPQSTDDDSGAMGARGSLDGGALFVSGAAIFFTLGGALLL